MGQNLQIINLLQQILGNILGISRNQTKSYLQYSGIMNQSGSKHSLLYDTVKNGISEALKGSGLPGAQLFGPLLGSIASGALVGKPTNKYGTPNSLLAMQPGASGGATFSNAFQAMLYKSADRYLTGTQEDKVQDQLKRSYLRRFYKTFYSQDSQQTIQNRVKAAESQPLMLPNALNFLLDPEQLSTQVSNISDVATNTLRLGMKRNPFDVKNTRFAKQLQQSVKDMALTSAQDDVSFGGFTPTAVTTLAEAVTKTKDVLRSARDSTDPQALKNAIDAFRKNIQGITEALMPMRNIFGNDMTAIIDMIQSLSGRSIGDINVNQIRTTASLIQDSLRYSGASPKAVTTATAAVQQLMQGYGADALVRQSRSNLGATITALTSGSTPGYLTKQQYQAAVVNSYASAQSSIGVRRLAQAYGLAQHYGTVSSLQQFVQKLQQSDNPLQTALQLSKSNSVSDLFRGDAFVGTQRALQSGALASIGTGQQYKSTLITALQSTGASAEDVQTLYKALTTQGNKELADRAFKGIDQNQVISFRVGGKNMQLTQTQRGLLNMLSVRQPQLAAAAGSYMQQLDFTAYRAQQRKLNEAFDTLNKRKSGGIYTFFTNYINNSLTDQVQKQAGAALDFMTATRIFDIDPNNKQQLEKVKQTLRQNFNDKEGGLIGTLLASGTMGAGSLDKKYLAALKRLGTETVNWSKATKQQLADRQSVLNVIAFGDRADKVTKALQESGDIEGLRKLQQTYALQMAAAGDNRQLQQKATTKYRMQANQYVYKGAAIQLVKAQNKKWKQQDQKKKKEGKSAQNKQISDQQVADLIKFQARVGSGQFKDPQKAFETFLSSWGNKAFKDIQQKKAFVQRIKTTAFSSTQNLLSGTVADLQKVLKWFIQQLQKWMNSNKNDSKS